MIKKITNNSNETNLILDYLNKDKYMNVFMIGDIQNFGCETDFLEVWAEFDNYNACKGVMLRFFRYYVFCSYDNFDAEAFAQIVLNDNNAMSLAGSTSNMDIFYTSLPKSIKIDTFYAKMSRINKDFVFDADKLELATTNEVNEIALLRDSITEFGTTPFEAEPLRKVLENNAARCYIIRENGKLVSMGATRIESDEVGIIGSVGTIDEYRNKGYGGKCTYQLCKDLLGENKEPVLFYSTKIAESIYKKMGFEDIGLWTMLML